MGHGRESDPRETAKEGERGERDDAAFEEPLERAPGRYGLFGPESSRAKDGCETRKAYHDDAQEGGFCWKQRGWDDIEQGCPELDAQRRRQQ
ncbi:hypothetical protein HC891_28510 [Candidatus Gracilibacteria bacterium]|nr:hypothetical protein [Candidatus Gracilibacteria bacterium]